MTDGLRFGLIGYPIGHSKSPEIFAKAYSSRFPYDLIETPSFEEAWEKFITGPYKAVNVTAPFKMLAAGRADVRGLEVESTGAANILIKKGDGLVEARNSDYLGVKSILEKTGARGIVVIGGGGAGKAALQAALDLGLDARLLHHDEIGSGVSAEMIIYTLPKAAPGFDRLNCRILLEANYRDPVLTGHEGYIPGTVWHRAQAVTGYALMTGIEPDAL